MIRYSVVSIVCGLLFGIMDAIVQGNPLAREMLEVYRPIAKTSVNVPAGILIDLSYGFILCFIFLLLYRSLPGKTGFAKGISFGLVIWFLRVAMNAASSWMMFIVPPLTLLYIAVTGLLEMLLLGSVYGVCLKPQGKMKQAKPK